MTTNDSNGHGRTRGVLATIIALIAAMAIALPFTFLAPSTASAADGTDGGALEITSSQLAKTTIVDTEGVQLTLEFRVPDNAFHAGDTSTIQLPAGFVFYSDSTFDVTSSTGVTVAHATVTRDASTMTMTYTDYVDDHSNITGSLHFTFKMDPNNEPAQGDHPFDLLVDNKPVDCGTITVGQMQGDDPNETFAKYGWQDTSTPDEIQYAMRVNGAGIDMHDVTLTDTLETPAASYLPESFAVKLGDFTLDDEGHYQLENQQDITDQCPRTFTDDGRGFSISLPDLPGKGAFVLYKVKVAYTPQNGELFDNAANGHFNGEDHPYTWQVKWQTADGEANGYHYGIRLTKTDAADGTLLAGAVYTVTRDRSQTVVGTLTTDADGEATVDGLLANDYTLTETTAPDGYEIGEPLHVTYEQFQDAAQAGGTSVDVAATDTKTKPEEPVTPVDPEPSPKPNEPTPGPTEPAPEPTTPSAPAPTTGTASKTPSAPAAATPAQHQTQSPLAATGVSSAWICSVAIVLAGVAASLLAVRRLHD